jgi:FKBP12-rapamycin complex-associated protein
MDHNPQDLLAAMDGATISGVQPPSARTRARTNSSAHPDNSVLNGNMPQQPMDPAEAQNAWAVEVLARVNQKLTGGDFKTSDPLDVLAQVDKLIIEATKFENLCQHYIGWCSFW